MVWLIDLLRNGLRALANLRTRLPGSPVDYVLVELAGSYPERTGPRSPLLRRLFRLSWQQPLGESLEALRGRLARIARSPRVRGIVLRFRDLQGEPRTLATVQSLRQALAELRRRGKRIVVYLPDAHLAHYYLATAADEIWMPEAGMWQVTGLRTEVTFYRDALDRIGLLPEFERVAEYKTAADPFMRSTMSESHREVVESVLDSVLAEIARDVAASRRLDAIAVRGAINNAPMSAGDAKAAGLIDGLCYEDELPVRLGSVERPAALVPWPQARRRLPQSYRWRARTPVIGVVELLGGITTGESRDVPLPVPLVGGRLAGSDTIARAFRTAERHPRVRAIIFHVDSRGGSALASDLIWREVERIKVKKPVVVYMGNVAGSGGYYVACGASRIIAQPTTITGSIGVIGGKLTARGLYTRLGLNREIIARGHAATIESMFQPFTPEQLERTRREMRAVYQRFVGRVAAGRRKTETDVEAIARGRIWTGRQALEHGLVDELGDFAAAVDRAKELAGIAVEAEVSVVTMFPPPVTPIPSSSTPRADAAVPSLAGAVAEVVEVFKLVGALAAEAALLIMPEFGGEE